MFIFTEPSLCLSIVSFHKETIIIVDDFNVILNTYPVAGITHIILTTPY